MENGNYPQGYQEQNLRSFPMPKANEENDVKEQLFNEYSLFNESFEDFNHRMFEMLGELWVFKLSRKSKDK